MKEITNIISILNYALYHGFEVCYLKKTRCAYRLLESLVQEGIVKAIRLTEDNRILIQFKRPRVVGFNHKVLTIKALSTPTRLVNVTHYNLKSLMWRHRRMILLVSSSGGIITPLSAKTSSITSRVGGILLGLISIH